MVGEMSTKVNAVGKYRGKFGEYRVRILEVCEEDGVEYALCEPTEFLSIQRWIPLDQIDEVEAGGDE